MSFGNVIFAGNLFFQGGLITVTNGSAVVTGSLNAVDGTATVFSSAALEGDTIAIGSTRHYIKQIVSDNEVLLTEPWGGPSATNSAYTGARAPWHLADRALAYKFAKFLEGDASASSTAVHARDEALEARDEAETALGLVQAIKDDVVALGESEGTYATFALANAAIGSIPADRGVYVTNDGANNGLWVKRSGVLVKESDVTVPGVAAAVEQAKVGQLRPTRLRDVMQVVSDLTRAMTDDGRIFEQLLPNGAREFWETRTRRRTVFGDVERVATASPGFVSQVMSDEGDIVAGLRRSGSYHFGSASIDRPPRLGSSHAFAPPGTLRQILDIDGNIGFRIDTDGHVSGAIDALREKRAANLLASVALFIIWGQSLSYGIHALPALSTTQKFNAQMFVGGRRPHEAGDDATAYASLVPLVESDAVSYGETPASGMAEMIRQLLIAENGLTLAAHEWAPLVVTPGEGSTLIDDLDKGSTLYNARVPIALSKAYERAQAIGKSVYTPALPFIQGERDVKLGTAPATYKAKLAGLQADFEADANACFGTAETIPLILPQTVSHHGYGVSDPLIAQAQLEVARTNPKVLLACSPYFLDFHTDNIHLTNISSRIVGAYLGLVTKHAVIDEEVWQHLDIDVSRVRRQGAILIVPFKGVVGSLVLDTSTVAAATAYGLSLVDNVGTAIAINSVALTGPKTLTIVAASAIPAGSKLRAGWNGSGSNTGRMLGPRTNIRDRAGEGRVFDPGGIAYHMHNWLPIQENTLS